MTPEATLAKFREHMVGPARFMNLLSCFELGVIDALRERPGLDAVELGRVVGAKPDAVEQLLHLPVKEGFVAYDPATGGYSLDALADLPQADLDRVLIFMDLVKVTMLRQLYYLTESVKAGTVVGLKEFYGYEGNLFGAVAEHKDLRESWATAMDAGTARVDPWFFDNVEIPAGARVLDLAGNTGLGAINTYRHKTSPGLHVTTFDLPEKEQEALENFRANGVAEHCSFIGGDVFREVPTGFDVVLIRHFLTLWDRSEVLKILHNVNKSLDVGGQVSVLVPVYQDDVREHDSRSVDFYPAFFLGCAMGQGGPQKLSTWSGWLEECGFEVTEVVVENPTDIPADALPLQAVVSARKTA
ncbi:acetylserotonin O-methyltransferase [Saccharothrix sp. S26]|uniref:acetylserotonin O-methyltransferase n=1 Tax=Saccharothrix sp. S26 TaxID=2907215 RepID=UPI001F190516|nr:acetylserotonin O-methyltransferase [Saccharothrix sp. S26]MCE6994951.1 acetylserotonin O-methyltransferase [Saccharothrix sp. S26]